MERAIILLAVASMSLIILPHAAFAEGNSTARDIGWVSIGAGVLANVPFVVYNTVKKYSVVKLGGGHEITRGLVLQHSPLLAWHNGLNLAGFAAGAAHGIIFLQRLEPITLSLAVIMTALTASGIFLKITKSTNARFVSKLFHSQIILSGVLVILIMLHVMMYVD